MIPSIYHICDDIAMVQNTLIENGGELTPELEERLTLSESQLTEKADSLNGAMRYCEARAAEIAEEIKRLQGLKKGYDNSAKAMKNSVLYNMQRTDKTEIEGKFCKFYIRETQSLEVNEEELLKPYQMVIETFRKNLPAYLPIEVKVNKTAIKTQFKGTNVLPAGCTMVASKSLTTNRKSNEDNELSE